MKALFKALVLCSCLLVSSGLARASVQTFSLTYSGAPFANTASATGFIALDTALLLNPGYGLYNIGEPAINSISLTVTGSSDGNGTFQTSDFDFIFFDTGSSPLDFTKELVGQPTSGGFWGAGKYYGDFHLSGIGLAPTNPYSFTLRTFGGDYLQLVSMTPTEETTPVPEPSTYALLVLGLGGFALLRKKSSK